MKTRTIRPRDAGTLILVRGGKEVLMGRRNPGHAFLPDRYVFPGGAVDRADHYIMPATELRAGVEKKLSHLAKPGRGKALALAAIRETFEETGLLLGRPLGTPVRTRSAPWRAFFDNGVGPTLDVLDFVARAITPPFRPRRFDARFFIADADRATGRLGGNGELLDLQWVPFKDTQDLPLPRITALVIDLVSRRLAGERVRIPLVRYRHGEYVFEYH